MSMRLASSASPLDSLLFVRQFRLTSYGIYYFSPMCQMATFQDEDDIHSDHGTRLETSARTLCAGVRGTEYCKPLVRGCVDKWPEADLDDTIDESLLSRLRRPLSILDLTTSYKLVTD